MFSASLRIDGIYEIGATPFGDRRALTVEASDFSGPRIQGTVLSGGLELELELANGALELEQIDVLRTDDGTLIYMRTCGFAGADMGETRVIADFEAPLGSSYAWLNSGTFAGTRVVDSLSGAVELAIYDISNVDVAAEAPTVRLQDPAGVPHQPTDCAVASGARGAVVFTENVALGASLAIGASKRGNRNIIPITGGTVSGRFNGAVVPGGADYQLISGTAVLDARYLLSDTDGEHVLVRNCGPFGALVPQFESRSDGPYGFLNVGRFISSDPAVGNGSVGITFYELQ